MEKLRNKVGELLTYGYESLKRKNIDSYRLDAELLLGKVLGKDKLFLLINRDYEVEDEDIKEYYELLNLREKRMPVKYILGECEFMGLNFYVKQGVLIPRPDTETLVEEAIEKIKYNGFIKICDACCGSGAIGISIAKLIEDVRVICCDKFPEACEVTKENIRKFSLENRVQIVRSDLLQSFILENEKFDIIVCNPPYIKEDVISTLMSDVRDYEPYEALCGGKDGLKFYRKIVSQSLELLDTNGMIMFEIGYDERQEVEEILKNNGFSDIQSKKDLAGRDRVVLGKL
ncbi:MAG: peptide chain release factor N(5)-glutamine methyltransferase [Clostridium sp.]|jgi:release factor glutamine methyltransferase|uniref:peptide chain release factor N(5)-glutamine methyltransferase n=1 Tax=Clostridium sp. TaxID=1506 RepID=UPI0025C13401|nr:peptide chain release factor N(5)-glutamine methyltransferase [Clostridium sp.]MCH3965305.1 peptide chain release factor N(5)-glutamine methyltransferase [Clostridium sp.]MCI1714526.1 peptide chain release factor N(5)-glutamine methyltransferase [Clostridium sp.]MCI1798788.1 peptide chain release factor N(5)-glutamine methyltransferase [Clostridium sp.]MCI1812481.1 peptide chain release factor N(5)-glutamine methyltransferase [Clostridium sp.]MCI1869598.1 peptide chain release factor N(5)-g